MQELLINEDQLIYRRNELENKQKYLCTLLHTAPMQFNESSYSVIFDSFHLELFFQTFQFHSYKSIKKFKIILKCLVN